MALNKSNGLALILIVCGVLMVLGKLGLGFGSLFSFLVPIIFVGFGYISFRNGRVMLGSILMFIGVVVLFGKLAGVIGWIIAIVFILCGFNMLKRRGDHSV